MAGSPGDYLVVGDPNKPSTWHLPVKRNGKPDRKLAAAAWAALHSNFRGNPYGGPNKSSAISKLSALYRAQGWETPGSGTTHSREVALPSAQEVRMSGYLLLPSDQVEMADEGADGDFVIRRGKIFEAGEYSDKDFHVSEAELQEAVNEFTPVVLDVEHRPSIFDGQLGELFHVDVGDRPQDLQGWVSLPRWLNQVVGDRELKVSTTWSRDPKRITRLALTVDPRIEDAAMLSAFSSDDKKIETKKEKKTMSLMDRLKASLVGASPEEIAEFVKEPPEADDVSPTPTTPLPETKAPVPGSVPAPYKVEPPEFARIRSLEAQVAEMAASKRTSDATTFIDSLIRDRRLLPGERASNIAELSQAMEDDAAKPGEVTFKKADGGEVSMSRTNLRKANLSARPQHDLFSDHRLQDIPPDSVVLHSLGAEQKSEYDKGYEYGQKYVDQNYPKNGNGNGNGNSH